MPISLGANFTLPFRQSDPTFIADWLPSSYAYISLLMLQDFPLTVIPLRHVGWQQSQVKWQTDVLHRCLEQVCSEKLGPVFCVELRSFSRRFTGMSNFRPSTDFARGLGLACWFNRKDKYVQNLSIIIDGCSIKLSEQQLFHLFRAWVRTISHWCSTMCIFMWGKEEVTHW